VLTPRFKAALVVLAASAGLSACATYGSPYGGSSIGVGIGYGSPYGYGYGYGSPYGYNPYYSYGRYPYFGWNDGFYYPGAGYWMYDPWGRQYRLTERQSHYWSNMLKKFREERGADAAVTQNFAGFRAKAKQGATIKGVEQGMRRGRETPAHFLSGDRILMRFRNRYIFVWSAGTPEGRPAAPSPSPSGSSWMPAPTP